MRRTELQPKNSDSQPGGAGGVIADKLVLWNCKSNCGKGSRHARSWNVQLREAGKVVRIKEAVPLEWSKDELPDNDNSSA